MPLELQQGPSQQLESCVPLCQLPEPSSPRTAILQDHNRGQDANGGFSAGENWKRCNFQKHAEYLVHSFPSKSLRPPLQASSWVSAAHLPNSQERAWGHSEAAANGPALLLVPSAVAVEAQRPEPRTQRRHEVVRRRYKDIKRK